jgi:hypothetical protein
METINSKELSTEQQAGLLSLLESRFNKNMSRHKNMIWSDVELKLMSHPEKVRSLKEMEDSGGEPDVVAFDSSVGTYIFMDCSIESPKGRRSLCYDREALDERKEFKPMNSVIDLALEMGIQVLTEQDYRSLQALGNFDTKTSSWLMTPPEIRKLGGAIFGDYRYGNVFIYHNGAQSYYGGRGFRGKLTV